MTPNTGKCLDNNNNINKGHLSSKPSPERYRLESANAIDFESAEEVFCPPTKKRLLQYDSVMAVNTEHSYDPV